MHLFETQEPTTVAHGTIEDVAPDKLLTDILVTRRCYGSSGDIQFRNWLISHIEKLGVKHRIGPLGNIIVTVGKNKVLFSCHTDTVHNMNESNSKQDLSFDPAFQHLFLSDKTSSTCLGADDGAGIYIMLKMLEKKVAGTYIFHVGEEKGGKGAYAQLDTERDWLKQFTMSIAFDRPNDNEVICTQGGCECASVTFGEHLAKELNSHGLNYSVSHRGVFTDNKVYQSVIRENVNLGVGYVNQHTKDEYLDYGHVERLLDACLKINWQNLTVTRELPKPTPFRDSPVWTGKGSLPSKPTFSGKGGKKSPLGLVPTSPQTPMEAIMDCNADDIHDLVETDPWIAAQALISMVAELEAYKAKVKALERLLQ